MHRFLVKEVGYNFIENQQKEEQKREKKDKQTKCRGHWRFVIEVCVALISPFLPNILDYLKNLFQFFL